MILVRAARLCSGMPRAGRVESSLIDRAEGIPLADPGIPVEVPTSLMRPRSVSYLEIRREDVRSTLRVRANLAFASFSMQPIPDNRAGSGRYRRWKRKVKRSRP